MNRRDFLKFTSMGVVVNEHSWINTLDKLCQAEQKPNVLFIAVDDLNDWIGCLGGYAGVKTPHIDKLASQGILFANAHSPAPVCYPSRTSLMTGWYPSKTGVYLNKSPAFRELMPNIKTIPEHFKEQGYHTISGGKVFHEQEAQLWDESVFFPRIFGKVPKLNGIKDVYPEDESFDWGPLDISEDDMPGGKTVTWAKEILKREYDKPLFLAVGFHEPHMAWYAPKKYFDLYPLDAITLPLVKENDLEDVPPMARQMAYSHLGKSTPKELSDHQRILDKDLWKSAVQAFLADISYLDTMIGNLLAAFHQSQYAENAIIVFWSDNGFHLGEKNHWRKATLWEEATRVPLIFTSTKIQTQGQICQHPVSLIDIYPTLLELCGLPQPAHELEGHSLVPLLKNTQYEWQHIARTTYGRGNHAIRSKDWRYIRYKDGSEELYDHRTDTMEWNNLVHQEIEVKKQMSQFLPLSEQTDNWCVEHTGDYAACANTPD